MRCPNCNALVGEDELFCGECGARVAPPAPPTMVTPPTPPPARAGKGGGASKALLGGGALAALIVVVVVVCLCLAAVVVASGVLNLPAPTPTLAPPTTTPTPRVPTSTPVRPTPTIRPTATPRPTSDATPTVVVSSQGFTEDFSQDAGNWDLSTGTRGRSYIQDGELHIVVTQTQSVVWTRYEPGQFQDFTLEVDGRKVSGPDSNDYGVLFRYVDRDNFYRFVVSSSGQYRLDQQLAGDWNTIQKWTTHDAVKKGTAVNRLKVVAQGDTFKLYVNDVLVDTITDDSIPQAGQVALVGGSYDEANVHVAFDNVRVRLAGVAFQDDFTDNKNGWTEGAAAFFQDGEYHIYDTDRAHAYWCTQAGQFDNVTIEARVRKVEGDDSMAYGLAFRVRDLDNFYAFALAGDGRYVFSKREAGKWMFIVGPKNSAVVIKGNSANVLRVVCKGSSFELYINGQKVDTVQDDAFSVGYVGFEVDQGVHFAVDDLTVWKE